MSNQDRFISERSAAGGPRWQWLAVGDWVKPKGGRKLGTVIAIINPSFGPDGVPTHVAIRWDSSPQWSEMWATDCLVVLEQRKDAA